MKRTVSIILAAVILAALSSVLFAQAPTVEKLASGSYVVYAKSPQAWRFTVDSKTMANATVTGHFSITEGAPKNIDVFVFDEASYFKWRNEDASGKPIFSSGRKGDGDISVKLANPGVYYVVFSDSFAYEGMKNLTADVKLQYDKR